jgi:hypothetical protein
VALQEVTAFRYHNGRPAWLSGILQYGNALPIYTGQSGAGNRVEQTVIRAYRVKR